ncbi:MAG: hypothetical protein ACP5N7_01055 [Candidatus Pacearchaeota archaeon]
MEAMLLNILVNRIESAIDLLLKNQSLQAYNVLKQGLIDVENASKTNAEK